MKSGHTLKNQEKSKYMILTLNSYGEIEMYSLRDSFNDILYDMEAITDFNYSPEDIKFKNTDFLNRGVMCNLFEEDLGFAHIFVIKF